MDILPTLNSLRRNPSTTTLLVIQAVLTIAIIANLVGMISYRMDSIDINSGIDEELVLDVELYHFAEDFNAQQVLLNDIETLTQLNGITAVATTNQMPLEGSGSSASVRDKVTEDDTGSQVQAAIYRADHHLSDVLGLTMKYGRTFRPEEIANPNDMGSMEAGAGVVISSALAMELLGRDDVVGEVIYFPSSVDIPLTVIGVAEHFYGPWPNWSVSTNSIWLGFLPSDNRFQQLAVRFEGISAAEAIESITTQLYRNDDRRVVVSIEQYHEIKDRQFSIDYALLFSLGLIIALLISVISLGAIGMAVFNVERRTKQIGTRRALGATKRDIVTLFLMESGAMLVISMIIGVPVALALNWQLMSLFSLPSLSVVYPLSVGFALLLLSVLGILFPAISAAKVPPSVATRSL